MHSAFTAGRRQKTVASHGSEKLESNLLQVSAKEREALLILALYCSHYKQMHFFFLSPTRYVGSLENWGRRGKEDEERGRRGRGG